MPAVRAGYRGEELEPALRGLRVGLRRRSAPPSRRSRRAAPRSCTRACRAAPAGRRPARGPARRPRPPPPRPRRAACRSPRSAPRRTRPGIDRVCGPARTRGSTRLPPAPPAPAGPRCGQPGSRRARAPAGPRLVRESRRRPRRKPLRPSPAGPRPPALTARGRRPARPCAAAARRQYLLDGWPDARTGPASPGRGSPDRAAAGGTTPQCRPPRAFCDPQLRRRERMRKPAVQPPQRHWRSARVVGGVGRRRDLVARPDHGRVRTVPSHDAHAGKLTAPRPGGATEFRARRGGRQPRRAGPGRERQTRPR